MSEPQKFVPKTSSNDDNIISTVQYLHNEEFLINIVFFISSQLTIKNNPMDIPSLNEHKQNCGSASAESKPACIIPSASKFAAGKQEYPPMHNGEFDTLPIVAKGE